MKLKLYSVMLSLLILSLSASAQKGASPEATAFYQQAMAQINARHVRWIKSTASEVNEKNLPTNAILNRANTYGTLGNMNGQDIEALAFLVMMEASKSAREDLKAIMAHVKSINEQKEKLRAIEAQLNDKSRSVTRLQLDSFKLLLKPQPEVQRVNTVATNRLVSKAEIDDMKIRLWDQRDSLAELGEEQQLKMQMIMDRMTKADSAASNMMKKFSEVASSIIANMK